MELKYSFNLMKSPYFRLLVFVFFAALFYDDPQLFLWKRLIYSVFLYLSIWQLIIIHRDIKFKQPTFPPLFKIFFQFYVLFIAINLAISLFSPKLNWITLINNPYAMLSVVPVFAFGIGFYADKKEIIKVVSICCLLFPLMFYTPAFSKLRYYPGYVCSAAIIPAFVFAIESRKRIVFYALLLCLACVYSSISDYRVIMLKVSLFVALFVSLNLFKQINLAKLLLLFGISFFVVQMVTNLESFLGEFQKIAGIKNFDTTDTRSFLYEEFFGDLRSTELFLGRGFFGSYFSEYFLQLQQNRDLADSFDRFTVEVGFLELILKGGFVYVFFYFFPLVYTCLKAQFSKKANKLCFNLSIYILVEILVMFFENIPFYNFQFFLLFFIAGFVYRNLLQYEDICCYTLVQPRPVY